MRVKYDGFKFWRYGPDPATKGLSDIPQPPRIWEWGWKPDQNGYRLYLGVVFFQWRY